MLMTEIRRDAAFAPLLATDELNCLAKEASEVLGYGALAKRLDVSTTEDRSTLRAVLDGLSIDVLAKVDVEQYMAERRKERAQELFNEWLRKSDSFTETFNMPGWEPVEIAKYKEPIPEFVVNKAVQIKKACPEIALFIVHLTEAQDPFLVAKLGGEYDWDWQSKFSGESYFIEVWDEPKFEGRI